MRTLSLLVCVLAALPAAAAPPAITTRVSLDPSRLDEQTLGLEGFERDALPGRPALPFREVAVALHPAADLGSIRIQIKSGPTDTLPGRRELAPNGPVWLAVPGQPPVRSWLGVHPIVGGRHPPAFGSRIFPGAPVERGRVTDRRGLKVLHLRYAPLRYRHATRELYLDRHTEVLLSYRLRPGPAFAPDPLLAEPLGAVENREQAAAFYRASQAQALTQTGYAILVPDAIAKASLKLAAFIKHKEALGFKVTRVGDSDLAQVSSGPTDGDAERMRGWLKKNYKTLNLRYVLIIGNPDPKRRGVPMKPAHAMASGLSYKITAPSDHYYGELTGEWDSDGDGQVAEYPDDEEGMDFTAEVHVGRIPVYDGNVVPLDAILHKTMAYETEKGTRDWRKRVLMPAAMLFYKNQYGETHYRLDGAEMAEDIHTQAVKPRGLTRFTLYEAEGVDPSLLKGNAWLSDQNLIAEWKKGYGLVTWLGHGSAEGAYRTVWSKDTDKDAIPDYSEVLSPSFFTSDDVSSLDDTRPSFVFHGSCSNGQPEQPDNLGYTLLRQGAIGTASATREAVVIIGSSGLLWASIFGVERDFAKYLIEGKSAGEALSAAKEKVSLQARDVAWLTKLEIALYGDPSVALVACASDAECDDGKRCNGKETCKAGQCASGTAIPCASTDPCTESSCDEGTGTCKTQARPEGEACEDGKFCTVESTCKAGRCIGRPRCAAPGNPCVSAACDETRRTCDVSATASEGKTCHGGTDREGVCSAGVCEPDASGCSTGTTRPPAALPLLALLALLALLRRRALRPGDGGPQRIHSAGGERPGAVSGRSQEDRRTDD